MLGIYGRERARGVRLVTGPRLVTERTLLRLAAPADAQKLRDYFRAAGQRYDPPLPHTLLTLEH